MVGIFRVMVEEKSLARNSLFNISYKGFNLLYPLITTIYISRIFLADGVGEVAFAINIVTYFTLIASLGIPNYAVKVLAPVRDHVTLLNKRFSELAVFILVSSLFATILYVITSSVIYHSMSDIKIALVLALMVISNVFNYDWLFESVEDYRYLAYRSIVVKLLALLLMFLLVKTREDILVYCMIYAGITVANNIWNYVSSRNYVRFCAKDLNILQHMAPVMTLFAAAFATEVYTLLDSTMLGVMCTPEHLGYYSNASRVARASFGMIFAIIAVFNPRLNYLYKSGSHDEYKKMFQRFYEIGMSVAFPVGALLFVLSPQIMTVLFGESFSEGIETLRLLSFLMVVFTLATVFGHIGLIIYGKERVLLYAAIMGAVVNFMLNQLLIPIYSHNGAAIASLISEILVAILLVYTSLKVCRIKLISRMLLVSIGITALLYTFS